MILHTQQNEYPKKGDKVYAVIGDERKRSDTSGGGVLPVYRNGTGSQHSIKAGNLLHAKSLDPRILKAMIARGKIVYAGGYLCGDGERIDIAWRSELKEASAPMPVDLMDRSLWPLLRKLAAGDAEKTEN
jgi:hypothetical protein